MVGKDKVKERKVVTLGPFKLSLNVRVLKQKNFALLWLDPIASAIILAPFVQLTALFLAGVNGKLFALTFFNAVLAHILVIVCLVL
jgi:hypothetical protein